MSRIVGLKAVEMSNPNASSRKTSGTKTASPCKKVDGKEKEYGKT